MDEIENLVSQTYRHFEQGLASEDGGLEHVMEEIHNIEELPSGPGILYHVQKTTSVFVIRTFVSKNISEDHARIIEKPEDYPGLRLLEGGHEEVISKLRLFLVENTNQAEIIHDQLNNRRFPIDEEMMCNLSDPGFSWWLTTKGKGFQLSFTLSASAADHAVKLGPLGDQQLALRNFQTLEQLITSVGLELNIQNEVNRVQFSEGEEFLMEELKDLFEFGVVSETLTDLFKLFARGQADLSTLEMTWYWLHEVAAMRRFWIQVQYDLNS